MPSHSGVEKRLPLQAQWNALLATALLGTEQREGVVVSPEVEFLSAWTPLDPEKEHEEWLLLASAYVATYRRAGQVPPIIQPTLVLPPAPAETKRYCSPLVAARLATFLNDAKTFEPLLQELLIALAEKERIILPALLPDLLAWSQRSKQRRALILPVVGERGHWLAASNPEWKNALVVDPKEAAEQIKALRTLSSQQTLYAALDITDNIFSKTYRVFTGQGFGGDGHMIQLVTDKIAALNKPGGTYFTVQRLASIAVAVPPVILPKLISRIRKEVAVGENTWLSRLVEFMELRQQMLEELNNE